MRLRLPRNRLKQGDPGASGKPCQLHGKIPDSTAARNSYRISRFNAAHIDTVKADRNRFPSGRPFSYPYPPAAYIPAARQLPHNRS